MPESHPRDRLRRELGLFDATLLVVSGVIGLGIFLTPGGIADLLPHPGLIFAAWIAGGLISLAGALANAELGAMYPYAGGDYVYVREAFHPVAGFLVGWLSFFAIYAGTIATLAAGFAESLGPFVSLGRGAQLALAVGIVLAVSAVNYVGVRWGARANNFTAVLKIGALVALGIIGLFLGEGDRGNLRPVLQGISDFPLSAFGLAMSPVLFSYLGWNMSVYVASEIRDPGRNVPRSLFTGLAICTLVYLIINGVYLYALPVAELRGQANVGEAAARALLGAGGGNLVALLVLASILGTLNAMVLVGPRIAYAMALDGLFFGRVDRAHPRFHTPTAAILAQALTAVALLVTLNASEQSRALFLKALDFTVFAILLATMADVAALYRLRRRRPERPRPYRAWGYPWLPGVYLVANACIAGAMLWGRPVECAWSLALVATGLPFFAVFSRRARG
jgi:APA family basic amino acid/polyamine antiporter